MVDVGRDGPALCHPRALPCHAAHGIPAEPSRPWLSHTNHIQVLPHHAFGVGAQEDVEVQDSPRRAPGQGRAGLQEHVWGSTRARAGR